MCCCFQPNVWCNGRPAANRRHASQFGAERQYGRTNRAPLGSPAQVVELGLFTLVVLHFTLVSSVRAELFVSSYNNNRVYRYNETNGAFLDVFVPNTNNLLNLPHGLAFGPDGNLYVASAGNDCVLRYNGTNGAFLNVFATNTTGALDYPVALIFRPEGYLYVSSQSNDCVVRFNATNGAFVDVFVTNSAALDGPSDMVFGPDGNLYVVGRFNSRVARYNGTNGALLDLFVTDHLAQPFGLCFGPDGRLLVVSGNENSVQRFDSTSGAFLNTFASGSGLSFPIGAVIGPDGNLYVASYGNHKIARFSSTNGAYLGDFIAAGSGGISGPNFMRFRPSAPVAPPVLEIFASGTNVLLAWTTNANGFRLEASSQLTANTGWITITNAASVADGSTVVTLPVAGTYQFFRLANP